MYKTDGLIGTRFWCNDFLIKAILDAVLCNLFVTNFNFKWSMSICLGNKLNKHVWVDAQQHYNRKDHFGPNLGHKNLFLGGFVSTRC